jgi:cytochrome c biogenesis protein CcmG, thiol:disulfide interchange protein DsbE
MFMPQRSPQLLLAAGLLASLLTVTGCHSTSHGDAAQKGAIGTAAPEFSIADINGRKLSLADYKGKVVLLNFWATWCGPCEKEIPQFIELQNQCGPKGLQIVGLSMDDSDKPVHAFYERVKMNYPVAVADADLGQRYGGVFGLPVNFVIGRDGRIVAKFVGATDIATIRKALSSNDQGLGSVCSEP